jgi:hypothetical protein
MKKEKDILDHLSPEKINTPDNEFFESLSTKVAKQNPRPHIKTRVLTKIISMSLATAAVLLIAFVLFKDFTQPIKELKVEQDILFDVNDEEIYAYVDEHLDDFTTEEIEESFSDDIGSELDLFSNISQDEIMDYIENENIDLDEFEDELLIF